MATLAELPKDEFEGAVHLLLVGPSKAGKTKYIVELIKDGFTVVYVDNDNGKRSLMEGLKGHPDAMARVHYIKTQDIYNFCVFLFARDRFQWNETKDSIFSAAKADDDDDVLELYRKQIPLGVVLVFDSWTSATTQLLQDSADKNQVDYEVFNEKGQAVYGDAGRRADVLCMNMQSHPGHLIMQAHQEQYEILEKPTGKMVTKQSEMIVKQTVTVPTSVSKPHGFKMSKYFNEVGWMRVTAMGKFMLDFRQLSDRVGGGTPMKEGDPMTEMRFSTIFAKPKAVPDGWIRTVKAVVFKEEAAAEAERKRLLAEAAKAAKGTAPATAGVKASPTPSLPGKSLLGR